VAAPCFEAHYQIMRKVAEKAVPRQKIKRNLRKPLIRSGRTDSRTAHSFHATGEASAIVAVVNQFAYPIIRVFNIYWDFDFHSKKETSSPY
jgi:hypothetical protein